MAVLFAPQDPSGSAGIGASIGESLNKTLMMLTKNKMLQQQQQQQRQQKADDVKQGLSAMGIPEEVSEQIAYMPESQQNMFLKQFFGSQAFGAPQEGVTGQLEEGLQALEGEGQMGGLLDQQQQPPSEEDVSPITPQALDQDYTELTKQLQAKVDLLSPKDKKALKAEIQQARGIKPVVPVGASREAKPGYRLQAKPTRKKSFQELLATPRPSSADKYKAEEMLMKKEAMSFKKQKATDIDTKKYFDETMNAGKAARDNDMRLNRMEELLDKKDFMGGNRLTPSILYSTLETVNKGLWGVGLNLKGALLTRDAQEFEKLTSDFAKGVKEIFGSRLSTREVELYMKTIPNLAQSDAGKRAVIKNWKIMNQAALIRKKAMAEAIDMNDGMRPANLQMIVEKKVGPKLDRLARSFIGKKKR